MDIYKKLEKRIRKDLQEDDEITLVTILRFLTLNRVDDWVLSVDGLVAHKTCKTVWYLQIRHDEGGNGGEWLLDEQFENQPKETIESIYRLVNK